MNRSLRHFLLLAAITLAPAACSPGDSDAPPLQGASIGGPFTLTDQDGKRVTERDFAGKYRLVYFGFTYCPDVCPVDLQVIGKGLRAFEQADAERAARVQPIMITVDPERDTPAVMKRFVAAFHPRLIGLTGSPKEVAEVAKRYGVPYMKQEGASRGEYLVDHARTALLFGPAGEPIAIIPHDQGPEGVAKELDRWVT